MTRRRCHLCGKEFRPEHALDAICWACIIAGAVRAAHAKEQKP